MKKFLYKANCTLLFYLFKKISKKEVFFIFMTSYYNVGKMLSEAGKHYGESIMKNYSLKLVSKVDKKYNTTNLKNSCFVITLTGLY